MLRPAFDKSHQSDKVPELSKNATTGGMQVAVILMVTVRVPDVFFTPLIPSMLTSNAETGYTRELPCYLTYAGELIFIGMSNVGILNVA